MARVFFFATNTRFPLLPADATPSKLLAIPEQGSTATAPPQLVQGLISVYTNSKAIGSHVLN
jgi:hypothetical protein